MKEILKIIAAIAICIGAGAIGSLFTDSVSGWYQTIQKPDYTPPSWIFGPVWTVLYTFMGISLYLVIKKGIKENSTPLAIFAIQLFLNAIWTPIFFGAESIIGGFIVIILLWLAIIATITNFFQVSKPAAYLLIPYFLWVSFATLLNAHLLILN